MGKTHPWVRAIAKIRRAEDMQAAKREEATKAQENVVSAAIYHVRFPHGDTFEALTKAVENLPWKDLSGEQEINNGD